MKDPHEENHTKSNKNAFWNAAKGKGNLGAVFKDVTSSDSLKGYAVSIATAGAAQSLGFDPGAMGFNVESLKTVMLKAAADATIKTAVYGGSFKDNLGSALLSTAASAAGAYAAGKIGDHLPIDGSFEKILLHSALGGLMAEVMGSDFRTGAIAGGANEALVGLLGDKLLPANLTPGTAEYAQAEANLVALSKIVGVLGAAVTEGDLDVAAQVAENGTRYNFLGDHSAKQRDDARKKFRQTGDMDAARELVRLEGADHRSDELLDAYKRDPSSLSQDELIELTAHLQVYAYERLREAGPEKAQASLTSLLAGDQVFGYGYPYAGSKEHKLAWADAQRDQLGLLGSLWPHERSVDELTYLDAKHALRIGQELQGMANLGDPAIYFLGGSIGSAVRAVAATNGALQATLGTKQAFEGDKWNAAGNLVLGLLGVGTLGIKVDSGRFSGALPVTERYPGATTPSLTPVELMQQVGMPAVTAGTRFEQIIDGRFPAILNGPKGTGGATLHAADDIRFSQNSVSFNKTDRVTGANYTYDDLVQSMRANGWKVDPVDVVKMPDGKLTSMDNTRIAAAREAGVDVKANVRGFDDPLTPAIQEARGWQSFNTWGEAITGRINKQSGGFSTTSPHGSTESPRISGGGK
ncbi:DUF637 domain-containing protein [Pseudomonas sp. UFMG81]|uniref:DUF637 domain-containing protein n=1 Tax=Pseudomonas sp. UFMG81 TaxID=2745936 RepID=UPI002B26A6E0|nr:DUF637 domain-containing protein [Pseudomonas sp. UFMG81]